MSNTDQEFEMKDKYDFSKGERGKFFHADAVFRFPLYLEPDVSDYMNKLAARKGTDVQALVNEWLRANIRLVESAQ